MLGDALRKMGNGRFCNATTSHHLSSYMHQPVEESTCCYNDTLGINLCAPDGAYANGLLVFHNQFISLILPYFQILRFIESFSPLPDKLASVALGTRAPNGRPFANVQHTELDGGGISHQTHLSAKGIDLSYNLPLGDASDGRVARHLGNLIHVHCHQTSLGTHIGTGTSCLTACMTSSNDDYIIS